ncbi:MAG: hypothetical protein J6V42_06160 [Clostridia bacterium]|nr:hypothetical protein [Clostridia bacterium]
MVRIENHCCDCAVPGYPCRGSACPSRRVVVHYCDRCNAVLDDDDIYETDDGLEYCRLCMDELYN